MHRLITSIALALIVTACSGGSSTTTVVRTTTFDPTGSWELTSGTIDGDPFPLVDGFPVTMSVTAGSIGGTSACNDYGGRFVVDDGAVTAAVTSSNNAGCLPDVMDSEAAFVAVLPRVTTGKVEGDTMELFGDEVMIRFVRRAEVAFDEILDREWQLEAIVDGAGVSTPPTEPARLTLGRDGDLSGDTGCRTLTGRFLVTETGVQITQLAADGECAADLQDQDGAVISVLESFEASIEDGRLTLTASGNEALVYVEP